MGSEKRKKKDRRELLSDLAAPRQDQTLVAIERFQKIDEEFKRQISMPDAWRRSKRSEEIEERLNNERMSALKKVYDRTPSTAEGLVALVRLFIEEDLPGLVGIDGDGAQAICRGVLKLLRRAP